MKANLISAFPLLIGALLGVLFVHTHLTWGPILGISIFIGGLGAAAYAGGRLLIGSFPVPAVRIWQFQVLVPIAVIALMTFAMAELSDWIMAFVADKDWFNLPVDATRAKAQESIASAIYGTIAAFIGSIFLDDVEGQKGGLWPPAQIKRAIGNSYGIEVNNLKAEIEAMAAQPPGVSPPHEALSQLCKSFAQLLSAFPPSVQVTAMLDPAIQAHALSDHQKALEALAVSPDQRPEGFPDTGLVQKIERFERLKRAVQEDTLSAGQPSGWSYGAALTRAKIIKKHFSETRAQRS
ncbi:hypothetical protein [Pontivivens ytuae]|uniref:Uncharacterized protein n=1 Tax=Pontivivens ytuae TaxID=2789856 RepID=A0A7S9LUV1_9RHOB|nr:hypothetical protein [Pontivivens ytuae]QPH55588.1 hypothetical protein I0K15_07600 [Pontivivens ytuae]